MAKARVTFWYDRPAPVTVDIEVPDSVERGTEDELDFLLDNAPRMRVDASEVVALNRPEES